MVKNTKKSSVAHVSDRRVSTKRRKTLPFVSADRYDPKLMSTYLGYDLQPSRKFFSHLKVQIFIRKADFVDENE